MSLSDVASSSVPQDFVHLRMHTEYSLVDSVVRISSLMHRLQTQQLRGIAVTDQSNVFAMVNIHTTAASCG